MTPRSFRFFSMLLAALGMAAFAGCDHYAKPNRPLPASFAARRLSDGAELRASDFKGKPWVINLWVPG